jgi:integrase
MAIWDSAMPYSSPDWFRRLIPGYVQELRNRKLSETYVMENRRVLLKAHALFRKRGMALNPRKITREEILTYLDNLNGTWKYKEQCFLIFNQFLKTNGNKIAGEMNLRFPKDATTKADWLEPEKVPTARTFAKGPLEDLILELGFNNGARRIECLRLTTKEAETCIQTGLLTLRGKGPMGGKARTFSAHPNTREVLREYIHWRDKQLLKCENREDPPESLFIYVRNGRAIPYSRAGIEKLERRIWRRSGMHFSFHTMRRSFGRQMFKANVPVTVIQRILGHESLEMTIRYLGLNIEDTSNAMSLLSAYQTQQERKSRSR